MFKERLNVFYCDQVGEWVMQPLNEIVAQWIRRYGTGGVGRYAFNGFEWRNTSCNPCRATE